MPQNQFPSSRCSCPGLCKHQMSDPEAGVSRLASEGCETGDRAAGAELSRLERQRLPFKTLPNATDMESDVVLKLRFVHAKRRVFVDHCECRMHGTIETVEISRLERANHLIKSRLDPGTVRLRRCGPRRNNGARQRSAPAINLSWSRRVNTYNPFFICYWPDPTPGLYAM